MISRHTTIDLMFAITRWAVDHGVGDSAVRDLLVRMNEVQGNRSFKDSMSNLIELYDQQHPGRKAT